MWIYLLIFERTLSEQREGLDPEGQSDDPNNQDPAGLAAPEGMDSQHRRADQQADEVTVVAGTPRDGPVRELPQLRVEDAVPTKTAARPELGNGRRLPIRMSPPRPSSKVGDVMKRPLPGPNRRPRASMGRMDWMSGG